MWYYKLSTSAESALPRGIIRYNTGTLILACFLPFRTLRGPRISRSDCNAYHQAARGNFPSFTYSSAYNRETFRAFFLILTYTEDRGAKREKAKDGIYHHRQTELGDPRAKTDPPKDLRDKWGSNFPTTLQAPIYG